VFASNIRHQMSEIRNIMVDRLVPEAMTRAHANAFGTTRSTLSRAVFTCSRFPARHAEAQRRRVGSVRVAHRLAATISRLKKKSRMMAHITRLSA
jgi:hypothetical protein